MIFVIGSVLLGVILGRFFKVLVLVPVSALLVASVIGWSFYDQCGLLSALGRMAILVTALQIGYASGMITYLIPPFLQRMHIVRSHRGSRASAPVHH
jgi:hypothetical protein